MRRLFSLLAATCALSTAEVPAQIVLDGTVGPSGSLNGPRYSIGAELGRQVGGNLFHSFLRFGLSTSETATFSGPTTVANIIGRVTGGEASSIDGTVRSTVPGANLFLINPSGIVFGAGARLDVQGSFHASTADELRLSDGSRISARDPSASTFTAASPAAFGFLGARPAALSVNGANLEVPTGKTLSLIAGDLTLTGGSGTLLSAPGGVVRITGAGSGNVDLSSGATESTATGAVRLERGAIAVSGLDSGSIEIRGGSVVLRSSSLTSIHTGSRDAAGGIVIEAPNVELHESTVETRTAGAGRGGSIRIVASDGLQLTRGARAVTQTSALGRSGSVSVRAGSLTAVGERVGSFTGIATETLPNSTGGAGDITVAAGAIRLVGGGISSSTSGAGNAGAIEVSADNLTMAGDGTQVTSGIQSQAGFGSTGGSGSIRVTAGGIDIRTGGAIVTGTGNRADGGAIVVRADRMAIVGDGQTGTITGIVSDALGGSSGRGGSLDVNAGELSIRNGGRIGSNAFGSGDGGVVTVRADRLAIANEGSAAVTGITTDAGRAAAGKAGNVSISAGDIVMQGGTISSSTAGSGDGGNIGIVATRDFRIGDGATVSAISETLAPAGSVSISAHILDVLSGAITTEANLAAGGNISIAAGTRVLVQGGRVTTSVSGGSGGGGDISIASGGFAVLQNGRVQANAVGGNGGNIAIAAGNFIASTDSSVEATSELGIDGTISIEAPEIGTEATLVVLPSDFQNQTQLGSDACAGRAARPQSSLTVAGRGALPEAGDAIRVARYRTNGGTPMAAVSVDVPMLTSKHSPPLSSIACR
jgi:filamentous hemagglutinin family protein